MCYRSETNKYCVVGLKHIKAAVMAIDHSNNHPNKQKIKHHLVHVMYRSQLAILHQWMHNHLHLYHNHNRMHSKLLQWHLCISIQTLTLHSLSIHPFHHIDVRRRQPQKLKHPIVMKVIWISILFKMWEKI